MRRCLVVANQTLCGEPLIAALRERLATGPWTFHVVVPATHSPAYASALFAGGLAVEGFAPPIEMEEDTEGLEAARERLAEGLERLHEAGIDADGEVGDPDPVQAIRDALARDRYDQIVLSTLAPGVSRWLRMDLVSRVSRSVDIPVTHVFPEPVRS